MGDFDNNSTFSEQPENNNMNLQFQNVNEAQQANAYMGQQPQYSANPAMGNFSPEQAMARANDYSPQTGYEPQGSYPGQEFQPQGGFGQAGFQSQENYQQGGFSQQNLYTSQPNYQQGGFQQSGYQQGNYSGNNYQAQVNNGLSYSNQVNNPQGGFNGQVVPGGPQNSGKKHTLQIIIVVAVFLLISLGVVSVFLNWGPFKQSGGRESVSDLMNDYISALNNSDVDAYLKLIPKAERTDREKSEIKKAMSKLEYTGGDMTITVGASKSYSDSKKVLTKDKLNKMSVMPVRVDSVQEVNATITGEGYEKHVIFTVIESNGKFFIDDLTEK